MFLADSDRGNKGFCTRYMNPPGSPQPIPTPERSGEVGTLEYNKNLRFTFVFTPFGVIRRALAEKREPRRLQGFGLGGHKSSLPFRRRNPLESTTTTGIESKTDMCNIEVPSPSHHRRSALVALV